MPGIAPLIVRVLLWILMPSVVLAAAGSCGGSQGHYSAKQISQGKTAGKQVATIPAKPIKIDGARRSPATIRVYVDKTNENAYLVRMDNEVGGLRTLDLTASAVRDGKVITSEHIVRQVSDHTDYVRVILPPGAELKVIGQIKLKSKDVTLGGSTKIRRSS